MPESKDPDDMQLDPFFASLRREAPVPSDALMARIMADAAEITAEITAEGGTVQTSQPKRAPRPGVLQGILAAIGGWPAAAGLATATVAGLAVGLSTPDTLETWTSAFTGYQVEDFMPTYAGLLEEG